MSKTVFEMAREVWSAGDVYIGPSEKTLELFAEIVRADERAKQEEQFEEAVKVLTRQLLGDERTQAQETIRSNHYTRSVPSGKSHYVQFGDAIVVWSIPANKNIARFVLGWQGCVWELSRLWAPDGHEKNLLTQAISAAVKVIVRLEKPDALVSYADPNAGHKGGVYRAASWLYHGKSEEMRTYRAPDGTTVSRRAFHSGRKGMRKAEIEALGYKEEKLPGKERFVRPISKRAARAVRLVEHHHHIKEENT